MRTARRQEHGYTLVGLLVAVAVINVALAVAATSWVTIDRRAREAELIWRGEQIVRALQCFAGEGGAGKPEKLEELVEANCLRREYRDPITRGDWRVFTERDLADGTLAALLGEAMPGSEAGPGEGIGAGTFGGTAVGGEAAGDSGVGRRSPTRPQLGGLGPSRMGSSSTMLGIVAVASTSKAESLRAYKGRRVHAEWVFMVGEGAGQAADPALGEALGGLGEALNDVGRALSGRRRPGQPR